MAANCGSLARLMQVGLRCHCMSRVHTLRVLVSVSSLTPSGSRPRFVTTETKTKEPPAGLIDGTSSFLSKLFGSGDEEKQVVSDEERSERQKLLDRVSEMYFAKPPREPDLAFYKEAFDLLIKYEDKRGVETVWRILEASKVQPDEELVSKVEDFLLRAREKSWFM